MSDSQRNSEWSSSHTNQQLVIPPLHGKEKQAIKASTKQTEPDPSNGGKAWDDQRDKSLPDNLAERHNDHKTWRSEPVNSHSQRLDRQNSYIPKNEPFDTWGSYEPSAGGEIRKANSKDPMADDDDDDLLSGRYDMGPTR